MSDEKRYTINDLAKIIGIPVSKLRFYQKNDLISPTQRDEKNGYYYYVAEDIQKVEKAVLLRELGMPIKTIKQVLDGTQTPQSAATIFQQYAEELKTQINRLSYYQNRIEKLLYNYNHVREYDVPFNTFNVRYYDEREILTKHCKPYKPENRENWVMQFSGQVERGNLPEEIPEVLLAMGTMVSRRRYQRVDTVITDQIFLVCEKQEMLSNWTNGKLEKGAYLTFHYDGKKLCHEDAFSRFEAYIEAHQLQVEDTFLHLMVDSMLPIICTTITFEIQAKLV